MKALVCAARALPMSFAQYVIQALLALALSVPLGMEVTRDPRALGAQPVFRAAALDRALELLPALRVQQRSAALTLLLFVALSPLLQMAWLLALSRPLGVAQAFADSARLYLRACVVSLVVLALLALALAPAAFAAYAIDAWIDTSTSARLHDLLLALCAVLALPLFWLAHVSHDLARAFALERNAFTSARLAVRAALSLRMQLTALPLALLTLLLGLAPILFAARLSALGMVSSTALLQAVCFGCLVVRSIWLAAALACTER